MRLRLIGLLIFMFVVGNYYTAIAQLYVPNKVCIQNPTHALPPGTLGCEENVSFLEQSSNPGGTWAWTVNGNPLLENSRNATYTFTTPGTYTVTATPSNTGVPATSSLNVAYYPVQPSFDKKDKKAVIDSTICGGQTIKLDPFDGGSAPSGVSYKWFPDNQTTSTIDVNEAGCYTVEVIDNTSGCSRFATINVKVCYEDPPTSSSNEKWYFGHGSGLEFTFTGTSTMPDPNDNTGSLDPQPEITAPSFTPGGVGVTDLKADEAVAQVLDKNRNIVLYTDGKKIFSGEDDTAIPLLSTGTDYTMPDNAGTQGLAIVPRPVCSACDFIFHYLFTVDKTTGLLSYSVVDMRENDKKGAVIEVNIPVAVQVFDKLAVERSADDLSYFITAFSQETNSFVGLTIDSLGIRTTPLANTSLTGTYTSEGYIAVSADGTQLAHGLIENGENKIEIFTRDPTTNDLSTPKIVSLGADNATVYGLTFSPNGQFLYVTLKGNGSTIPSKLIQIDLTLNTFEEISSSSTQVFGALGLGPKYGDGTKYVYMTIEGAGTVHYLQAPNQAGAANVGFTLNQSGHPGTPVPGTTQLGFPNVVAPKPSDEGSGLGANYDGNCFGVTTTLTAQEICDPLKNDFEWRVEGKKYTGKSVNHTFSRVGWHDVELIVKVYRETKIAGVTRKEHCTEVPFKGRIYIKPSPVLTIPDPLYICMLPFDGSSPKVTLDPKPTGGDSFDFRWMTTLYTLLPGNSTGPTFDFVIPSDYILEVTNNFDCVTESPIKVEPGCTPIIYIPNVITPDGSPPAVNEDLLVINHYIERPELEIYNRWGDMVFKTEDLKNNKWDGKVNGKIYHGQVYVYVLKYYARDFLDRGQQKITGSVLVLSQ